MTEPDRHDRAPGMGDPTRSDDVAPPGLRTGGAGTGAADQVSGPVPGGDATAAGSTRDADPGMSNHQGGSLGTAGGGYGSASGEGTASLGSPDGEDVQATSGPGPQTDWLRGADGLPDQAVDDLGR